MTETAHTNPLLNLQGLPQFSQVKPEHVLEAVKSAIDNSIRVLKTVVKEHEKDPTWDNVMAPIEEADDRVSRVWSIVSHLNGVCNTEELRKAHEACLPLISEYSTFVGQYQPLCEVLKTIKRSDAYQLLTKAQRKSIENSLRDFKLSGIDLPEDKKQRYAEIAAELSQLQTKFANNVLDATKAFTLHITDENEVKGLPASQINQARAEAKKRNLDGMVFTLDIPSYLPFMTYVENRELRKTLYEAYATRASDKGPNAGTWDNQENIENILRLRHEEAQLLGYPTYAHLSLATKMAETPEEVIGFLEDLARKSKLQGEYEVAQVREFAAAQGQHDLEPWDMSFYSQKLCKEKYAYDPQELRPYFGVEKVINGLFEVAQRLYNVSFRPRFGVDVWHEDVRCYDIYDRFSSKIGTFYLDLFARDGKQGGAWMDECMTRRYRSDGSLQLPVAYLVCNFTPPVNGKESLLTHDEVVTLFHEFGHGLNQLLTRIDISDVSGINGVPWDAVELPSQFNENFAWQEEVLNFLSCHNKTHEPLPKDKLDALIRAKNFQSAMAMLRQLEFALFDFRLHYEYDPAKGSRVYEILEQVRDLVSVIPRYKDGRFPDSFSHIFAGGYAAGYYSYKWAEVLAADAFSRFEEEGIFNPKVGAQFRDHILAVGGALDPMDCFVAFRGRKPQVDALLKQSGISEHPQEQDQDAKHPAQQSEEPTEAASTQA